MITLNDIAKALGTTKGTVSKALNGAQDVSDATRRAVLEKAVELGYTRLPRGNEAYQIAVFIANMEYRQPSDFGYDLILGIRKAAEPQGFQVKLISLSLALQQQWSYDSYMLQNNLCGGIFLGLSLSDPWLRDFETCRTPAVLHDNHVCGNPAVTQVGIDSVEGMRMAVNHMKSLGHKKIGYLSTDLGSYVYQQRYHGFFSALEECGFTPDPELAGSAFHVSDCLSQNLSRLLKAGCTAIVCSHDILASSALVYCTELGLSIPGDVSILGFDDIPLCCHTTPPLSTVRQDREQLGKSAFFALSSQLNNVPISTLLLHPQLMVRSSCSAPHI